VVDTVTNTATAIYGDGSVCDRGIAHLDIVVCVLVLLLLVEKECVEEQLEATMGNYGVRISVFQDTEPNRVVSILIARGAGDSTRFEHAQICHGKV
jgi:hypothetical protein